MKLKIYAIRDRATDQFTNPIFLISDGHAIRSFSDEINRKQDDNNLWKHSDDFDLYYLGTWETQNATFNIEQTPKQIAIGKQVRLTE